MNWKGKKIKYTYLIIIVEILLLFSGIISLCKPLSKHEYEGQELIAPKAIFLEQFMGEDRNGYYIDNSMLEEGIDLEEYAIVIPSTDLKKGSYEIKICYKTGTNVNTYTVSSTSSYWQTKIERSNVGLNPEIEECVFGVESDLDIEGYTIKIKFAGENYIFVDKVLIQETSSWRIKNLTKIIVLLLVVNSIWLINKKRPDIFAKNKMAVYVLIGGCVVLASQPVFAPYLYWGHDLGFHLNRIEGIKDSLSAGIFPVRMHYYSYGGAGYPVSIFYGDALLYFPALLRVLGWSVQSAYQIYIVAMNLLSAIIMYKVLKSIFKDEWIGCIGTFIYIMTPYRLECIYLRAAVGEYTALCFYPLIVYALYKIYMSKDEEDRYSWIYLSIGFSGLVLSHIISTFSAFVLTAIFCVVNLRNTLKKDIFIKLIKAVTLTFAICAGFLIPFIDYMLSGVMSNKVKIQGFFEERAITLSQLLTIFPHATGITQPIHEEIYSDLEMSYAIGGTGVIVLGLYLLGIFYFQRKGDSIQKLGDVIFSLSILSLWMTTYYFPWNEIEGLGGLARYFVYNIQFPWRFLGIASVLISIVGAIVLYRMKNTHNNSLYYSVVIALTVLAYISGNYFMTNYMNNNRKLYMVEESDVNRDDIGAGEYLPNKERYSYEGFIYVDGKVRVQSVDREKMIYYVECANLTDEEQDIQFPIVAYDNYYAMDMNTKQELSVEQGENYRVRVILPEGYCGKIAVQYRSPWYWRLSELISLVTLIGIVAFMMKKNGEKFKRRMKG